MSDTPLYDGPVIDAHQHFWEPQSGRYPWLRPDEAIPFRYGDYSALKRSYLPPDYERDAAGHRIERTVYMEAEWDPSDPIGETRYVSAMAERFGKPNAIIAQAWLDAPDAAAVLREQASFPLVRSVRHKPGGPASPDAVGAERSLMSSEQWRRGYAVLGELGLHFDLQTPWWNLHEAVRLARDFPAITIVLNHTGLPSDRSEAGLQGWRKAMAELADMPNAAVKISGIGVAGETWTAEANGWIVRETVAMFGPERAMFASNFPVDGLCASLDTIYRGFKAITAGLPRDAQALLFHDTALRLYRPVPAGAA
ncbi:amidohydrolase family protein [Marinivivus vitaminiproducens]|uniref:amidohydrolase family protein n=1 Tax=Marinivivus vitaminiproducens TaxID=3035935 RepID=UPI0027A4585E|nr:amidohydrolase family protein [Geminicoccaceae bacterium SCSIO 64248]